MLGPLLQEAMPLHLLDLPHALLIELLSSKHCSGRAASSAATTCRDLRNAALASVSQCHADLDTAAAAQVLAFACSLPGLRRLHLTAAYLDAADIHALAALTRLQDLHLEELHIQGAGADLRALTALTNLQHLAAAGHGTPVIIPALPTLLLLHLTHSGIAPAGMGALAAAASLQSLDLSLNRIGFEGARALSYATALVHLNLRACGIEEDGALDQLTALTHLDLSENSVSEVSVSSLTGLRWLELVAGRVGSNGLTALTALTHLNLSHGQLTVDVAASVTTLTSLVSLKMAACGVSARDVAALAASLTALTSLALSGNNLGDEGVLALARATQLQYLELRSCGVDDRGAAALAALTALRHLDLGYNGAVLDRGCAPLAALTALTFLRLTACDSRYEDEPSTHLTASTWQRLVSLTGLQHLHVGGMLLESAPLLAALTGLTRLEVGCSEWNYTGPCALTGLTRLQHLMLTASIFEEEALGAVALALVLPGLTHLGLNQAAVSDSDAFALAGCSNLWSLDLQFSRLGPQGFAALATLTALTHLNLLENNVEDEDACELTRLTRLRHLNLMGCPVSAQGSSALSAAMPRLTSLHLHRNLHRNESEPEDQGIP